MIITGRCHCGGVTFTIPFDGAFVNAKDATVRCVATLGGYGLGKAGRPEYHQR